MPSAGFQTPDLAFKAKREKEPVARYGPKQELTVFVTPKVLDWDLFCSRSLAWLALWNRPSSGLQVSHGNWEHIVTYLCLSACGHCREGFENGLRWWSATSQQRLSGNLNSAMLQIVIMDYIHYYGVWCSNDKKILISLSTDGGRLFGFVLGSLTVQLSIFSGPGCLWQQGHAWSYRAWHYHTRI